MTSLVEIAKRAEKFTIDNSPLILTVVGTAGVVATAVLTGKATFKAAEVIERKESALRAKRSAGDPTPHLTKKEKVRLTWSFYLPPAATVVLTCGAIIGANQIGTRRAAAMATAFTVFEKATQEYKDKVVEKFGEGKAQQVADEVAQDRVNREMAEGREVIIMGAGEQLFHDSASSRFFMSDMETVRSAVNDINQNVINDMYASLTDFYYLIGLERTTMSDELGWSTDKMLQVDYAATVTPDGRTAMSIGYNVKPIRELHSFH